MKHFNIVLTLMILVLVVKGADWQGQGNFTSDNITFIRTLFDTAMGKAASRALMPIELSKYISDSLNTEWNPAWNVVIISLLTSSFDTIVYGYAYNDHWLWFNNYKGSNISFIIWKDYNCHTWTNISDSAGDLDKTIADKVKDFVNIQVTSENLYNDPWSIGYRTVSFLGDEDTANGYSSVITQEASIWQGRICNVRDANGKDQYLTSKVTSGEKTISYLVFRTR